MEDTRARSLGSRIETANIPIGNTLAFCPPTTSVVLTHKL